MTILWIGSKLEVVDVPDERDAGEVPGERPRLGVDLRGLLGLGGDVVVDPVETPGLAVLQLPLQGLNLPVSLRQLESQ